MVWTRNKRGEYYLGRVTGSWRYERGSEHVITDMLNLRPVEMFPVGVASKVPGKVIAGFRGRTAFCQVYHVDSYSKDLFNEIAGRPVYEVNAASNDVFALMDDHDLEEVILLMLQLRGWLVYASGRKADTMSYECVLRHRQDGRIAVVQVKSGHAIVDARTLPTDKNITVFAFASKHDDPGVNVEIIHPDDVLNLLRTQTRLLPEAVQRWVKLAGLNPNSL